MRVGSYPYDMNVANIAAGEDVVEIILKDIKENLNEDLEKIIITGITVITNEDNMIIINDKQNIRLMEKDESTYYASFEEARATSMKFLKDAKVQTISFYYL